MSDQPGPGQQGQPQQQRTRRPYGDRPADMSAELAQVTAPAPKGIDTSTPVGLTTLNSLDDAYRYAYAMAQSSLLPKSLAFNAPNTLIVILYGSYLGIPPVIATQVISVVNGRPQIEGKMLITKIREAGHKFRVVEQTLDKCRVRITRKDEPDDPYEAEFTIDQAIKAGLCKRDDDGVIRARSDRDQPLPWENYTEEMLLWRAVARCCNIACPEVKMGLMVQGEEVTAPEDQGSRAERLGRVVAQRTDQQPPAAPAADMDPRDIAEDVVDRLAAMEAAHHGGTAPQDVEDAQVVTEPADGDDADRWAEVIDAEDREQGEQGKGRGRK